MATELLSRRHKTSGTKRSVGAVARALFGSPIGRDLVVCALAAAAIFSFVLVVEPFEEIYEMTGVAEHAELDDLALGMALFSAVLVWFSWRRRRESMQELVLRSDAERALQRAHDQLERQVEDRTAALAESETAATQARARLIDAIEAMQDGFVLFDAEDRLVLCNSRFLEELGDCASGIRPGLPFADMARAIIRTNHFPAAVGREEAWIQERLDRHRDPSGTFELERSDGSWVRIDERRTREGGVVAIRTDITELKLNAEALRKNEEQLRLVTDSLPVLIAYIDSDRIIRFANQTAADWYCRTHDEMVGRHVKEVLEESAYDALGPMFHRVLRGNEVKGNFAIDYPDGLTREIHLHYVPHRDQEGAVCGFIALGQDVTELKQTEDQLRQAQKLEAVGKLTGGIAHDFNNLLGVVLGNLELIEDYIEDQPNLQRPVENALKATTRGAELTQRLLAYSRKQALDPQIIDLKDFIVSSAELLGRTLDETIDLQTALPDDLWPAMVDPAQLETAILNLAINARDAMPSGGTLTIEVANTVLDTEYVAAHQDVIAGEYLMIAVTDTGTGMPPEVIKRAFDPFFTTKEVGKGSGLGLSMVFGFVKQSGGHVSIYSEASFGTSVKLYLRRPDEPSTDARAPAAGRDELPTGTETILVVEDNPDLRELARSVLDSLGYDVIEAEDGRLALAMLADAPRIDMMLTDVVLPGGMHGIDLAQQAQTRDPAIRILLMTGYTEHSILAQLDSSAQFKILHKPYRRSQLAQQVRDVLDGPVQAAASGPGNTDMSARSTDLRFSPPE